MKTKLLIIQALLISIVFIAKGQVIPNFSFENWTNGVNSAPDGWEDNGSSISGFYPAKQSNDYYLNNFAVELENKITTTDTVSGFIDTKRPNGSQGFGPSFPISTRYNNLKGFYKYNPTNSDSAQIYVYITKTGFSNPQGWGNLLSVGIGNLGTAMTYSPFSIGYEGLSPNFYYFDNIAIPDSGYMYLAAYKMIAGTSYSLKPLGNSTLIVDALNFDTYLTGINNPLDFTKNFNLYPNANSGTFDVNFETSKAAFTTIKVYDFEGREVAYLLGEKLSIGNHSLHYDLKNLANGNYLFVVSTSDGYKAEKLIIQK